ncbi:hypothetical protein NDU88_000566, partial [Pleurodeles waltl]
GKCPKINLTPHPPKPPLPRCDPCLRGRYPCVTLAPKNKFPVPSGFCPLGGRLT